MFSLVVALMEKLRSYVHCVFVCSTNLYLSSRDI